MSIEIPLSELSAEKISIVQKSLTVIPKKQDFLFGKKDFSQIGEPINFFDIIEEEGKEEMIRLPLFFARAVMKLKNEKKFPLFSVLEPAIELRPHQLPVFQESLQNLMKFQTTTLKAYPGFGKTALCALLSGTTRMLTLVFVHRTPLAFQWYKSFVKVFPELDGKIWIVGENPMPEDVRIIISMDERFTKIPPELMENVGCLVVDEAHAFCTRSRVKPLLCCHPKFVIVATATLERIDGTESMMYLLSGVHSVLTVNKSPFMVIKFSTGRTYEVKYNAQGADFGDLTSHQEKDDIRNSQCVELVSNNPHRKYIILVRRKNHVIALQKMMKSAGVDCATLYGGEKSYSDSQVLIGTLSKLSVGFDEENNCRNFLGRKSDTLILLSSISCRFSKKEIEERKNFKDVAVWEQVKGRIMRSSRPIIVYFVDNHPTVEKHFKGTKGMINYTNGVIKEVVANPEEPLLLPEPGEFLEDEEDDQ